MLHLYYQAMQRHAAIGQFNRSVNDPPKWVVIVLRSVDATTA